MAQSVSFYLVLIVSIGRRPVSSYMASCDPITYSNCCQSLLNLYRTEAKNTHHRRYD